MSAFGTRHDAWDGEDLVSACRLKQYHLARGGTWVALVSSVSLLGLAVLARWGGGPEAVVRALTAALTLIALSVAAWQWRAARHENSIDKFYDRLHLSNKMRLDAAQAAFEGTGLAGVSFVVDEASNYRELAAAFYVYTELDNLEYAVHKYRHGFISRQMTNRALDNFLSRCWLRGFTDELGRLYGVGSYTELDNKVISKLWELAEGRIERDRHLIPSSRRSG